jgi:hypothetical protein
VKTVAGADGRTWSVNRRIRWADDKDVEEAVTYVDRGLGAFVLTFTGLVALLALFAYWAPVDTQIPWFVWLCSLGVLLLYPVRWLLQREWVITAETSGTRDLPAELWRGVVRSRGRAREEMRVLIRNLRVRATPGSADSPMQPIVAFQRAGAERVGWKGLAPRADGSDHDAET